MLFSSPWLGQLDFEVRLRHDYSDPWAGVMLGWQDVEILAFCPSEKPQFYVSVDEFGWRSNYGHRFLLIPTPPVFFSDSHLAFNLRYRPLLRGVSLTKFSACTFLCVLCTAYRGVSNIFGKSTALRTGRPALWSLLSALLEVI